MVYAASIRGNEIVSNLKFPLLSCAFLLCLLITAPSPLLAEAEIPTLAFSAYLGGNSGDVAQDVAVDAQGYIYVTGNTHSSNFPVHHPIQGMNAGDSDVFVTKFSPEGNEIIYSTYLGGSGWDEAIRITVDAAGNAYIVGRTTSTDFPTQNALYSTNQGGADVFIAKLNPAGSALVYSTYLGGSGSEFALGVALDANQNVYVVGATDSPNFPTLNAFQSDFGGGQWDVFLTRLNASGTSLGYSTYFGGSDVDVSMDITADSAGNVYVTGETNSTDFPTLNAIQPARASVCAPNPPGGTCSDAYVAKFNPSGSPLFSTYWGGTGLDRGFGIAVDTQGSIYITGDTASSGLSTLNAYQSDLPDSYGGAFVTKLAPDGSQVIYSTYLSGTTGGSVGLGIAINLEGEAFISGATWDTDFPVVNPAQSTIGGDGPTYNPDTFVTRLNPDGSSLTFSTYLGGAEYEYWEFNPRIALDPVGNIHVAGVTTSVDFPTLNAYQPTPGGSANPLDYPNHDAFLAKFAFSAPAAAPDRVYFTTDTPTLTWNRVSTATAYRVQVADNPLFTGTPIFEAEVDQFTLSVQTAPLQDGTYYWRVQARNTVGQWGTPSAAEQFIVRVESS
jgi:hypothetical protein